MRRILAAVCITLGSGRAVRAQTTTVQEGALELIRATGARTVGMGQAVAAAATGSEAVWWNPALIARSARDARLDVRNKANGGEPETDAALAILAPVRNIGAFALSIRYINNGTQSVTNLDGQQVGSLDNTTTILGASFASTFSDRLALGFTVKEVLLQQPCTGDCTQLGADVSSSSRGSALDVGAHLFITRDSTLGIGVAVRNLGPKFQLKDAPQADPLPSRGDLGILFAPRLPQFPGVQVRVAADIVTALSGATELGYRFGGEITYQETYALRAGYVIRGPGAETTPTLGFGIATGKLHIDLSQMIAALGTEGSRPTFLSMRYGF